MNWAGGQATIENRLGRAGGLDGLHDAGLCQPDVPVPGLPVLSRSAALLALLLQDGTVDLELTSSVVALDPGLAFGTLQLANLERNGEGEVWQLPLAVVAAGCDRLLEMVNSALKVESNYDCGTSARFRRLYLRAVQRACLAEFFASELGNANPKQAYVAGLLFGLPGTQGRKASQSRAFSVEASAKLSGTLPARVGIGPSVTGEEHNAVAASVLLANGLLELLENEKAEPSWQMQRLAASPLWSSREELTSRERNQLLVQGSNLAKWAAANAPRLSPWEFMTRLCRHKSWE